MEGFVSHTIRIGKVTTEINHDITMQLTCKLCQQVQKLVDSFKVKMPPVIAK